jgi:hypothetical protein
MGPGSLHRLHVCRIRHWSLDNSRTNHLNAPQNFTYCCRRERIMKHDVRESLSLKDTKLMLNFMRAG